IKRVSSAFHHFSQSEPLSLAHCLVALMYPIGASSHTYSTFPSALGSGTGTPQSRSRVMARGRRPSFNQLLHWPSTCGFHSFGSWCCAPSNVPSLIHCSIHCWLRSMGRYQWLVAFSTGVA